MARPRQPDHQGGKGLTQISQIRRFNSDSRGGLADIIKGKSRRLHRLHRGHPDGNPNNFPPEGLCVICVICETFLPTCETFLSNGETFIAVRGIFIAFREPHKITIYCDFTSKTSLSGVFYPKNHNILRFLYSVSRFFPYLCQKSQHIAIIMDAKSIGRYIKLRRKDFNISQYTLAALSSISVNTLVAIERGEGNPRLENILSVLDTLGLQLTVTVKSDNTPANEEM